MPLGTLVRFKDSQHSFLRMNRCRHGASDGTMGFHNVPLMVCLVCIELSFVNIEVSDDLFEAQKVRIYRIVHIDIDECSFIPNKGYGFSNILTYHGQFN